MNIHETVSPINCTTEYGTLKKVILCPPEFMAIEEPINEVQKQYEDENIDRKLALSQHAEFERRLREHGVEVIKLTPSSEFPEQVFTRDIGFTVGDQVFVADMAEDIRQGEEEILKNWLKSQDILFQSASDCMEGGDVIVHHDTVYTGISSRTCEDACESLDAKLPDHRIVNIPFDEQYLHLDCVFNILSNEKALVFPPAFDKETLDTLAASFDLIEVSEEEQFSLGTNVLSVGNGNIFSLPQNQKVNEALRENGFHVIEVDFSEIIKSGGSFRCCSMPIERE